MRAADPGAVRLHLADVLGRNGQRMGRIEELERMNLGVKMILGLRGGGYVARWDQIDLSDPDRPRLTCAVDELQKT